MDAGATASRSTGEQKGVNCGTRRRGESTSMSDDCTCGGVQPLCEHCIQKAEADGKILAELNREAILARVTNPEKPKPKRPKPKNDEPLLW